MYTYPVNLSRLRPPALPARLLVRPLLLQRLQAARAQGCRLSLLSAPLGYGKSTLLAQYVAELTHSWAWLRCEPADNQPLTLLNHLYHALGLQQSAGVSLNVEALWAAINNHLEQLGTFTLVLDDLHHLRVSASTRYLNELLHHAPSGLHVLVATQGQPVIAFNHLRRDGRLQLIDSQQLALSSSEIEALAVVRGQPIASAIAYQLCGMSEGWVSAVLFGLEACTAATQLQGQITPAVEQQIQHWLAEFFEYEVLRHLPLIAQQLLERLSVLNAWDEALALQLSDNPEASAWLQRLLKADVFIHHQPDEGMPYRFHPQVRQVLYQRVQTRSPLLVRELHRRAADWLLQQRYFTDAIYQLGRARDFNVLLATLDRHSFDLLREGKIDAVVGFLADMPGYSTEDHLTLVVTEASVVIVINDVYRAGSCLRRLSRQLRNVQLPEQRLDRAWQTVAFLRSRLAFLGGNFAHGIHVVNRALRDYPQTNAASAVLLFNRGSNRLALGQLHEARKDTEQALAEMEPLQFSGYTNLLHWQLGQIELAQGDFLRAEQRFERLAALPVAERGHGFYDLFHYLGRGMVRLQDNQPEPAMACLAQAETLALAYPVSAGLPWVLHYQAMCLAAQGQIKQAAARWDEARRLARNCELYGLYRLIGAQRVRLAVREHDQDYILAWLQEWHGCRQRYAGVLSPEEWLAYAWVQRHLGQHPVALKIVADLYEQAQTENNQGLCIELHVLNATLQQDRADKTAALHSLDQALALVAGQASGRLLHQEGRALESLWRQLLTPACRRQHDLHRELPEREQLADLLRGLTEDKAAEQPLAEPLTRREQDVLRRIAQGQQNQQIADGLFISLSTVKTHINNLFRKLDAADREQAIQVARQLKLLGGDSIPPG